MAVTNIESFTTPRDSLPNVYTNVTAREQDFVSVFQLNWEALRQIMGIARPIKKTPGTRLKSFVTTVALESGNVDPGCVIPFSKRTVTERLMSDVVLRKYADAVTIEEVAEYGPERAIERGDEAFRNALQNAVLSDFYTFLNTGALTGAETSWQMALSMAKGKVLDKFQKMRKSVTEVVGFANTLDAYAYIGAAGISTQTQFGITYIKDFLGYSTLFLLSDIDIPRGTVIACPVENIDLYYVDPADTAFTGLGLEYTVVGETNLIGFSARGNYSTATGESYAIMGMTLWAEYLDGIAVINVGYESFAEYSGSTTGKNPAAEKWYEKAADDSYFRTTDEEPASGKTYYVRSVSPNP